MLVVGAMTIAAAFGATRSNTGNPTPPVTTTPSAEVPLPTVVTAAPVTTPALPELAATVARIAAEHQVEVGIQLDSVTAAGTPVAQQWRTGTLYAAPALGTIDLAMGMALVDDEKAPRDLDYMLNRSLADNSVAAREAIWAYLGDAEEASARTSSALEAYQNWGMTVQTSSTLNPDNPYHDTIWTVANQAEFMARMWCDDLHAYPVLSKLDDRVDDPWGMQGMPMAWVRADLGTVATGSVLARQGGLIRTSDGVMLGVSLVVISPGGDTRAATTAATLIARQVRIQALGFGPGGCRS